MRMTQWKPVVIIERTGGKPFATVQPESSQLIMVLRRLIGQYSAMESIAEKLALMLLEQPLTPEMSDDVQEMLRFVNKEKYGK